MKEGMVGSKKKKRTGARIFTGILLFLLILAVMLLVRFYPVWKAAGFLEENLNFSKFTYELEAELNREEMKENQVKLLDTLAELTGLEQEAMYRLRIQGSVDGDVIHARIYPEGQSQPLVELYLSDGEDVVNGALLYNAVRSRYAANNPLLAYLLPVWSDHEFVSLEQLEQMLDVDLGAVRDFRLTFTERELSAGELFAVLAAMEREQSGSQCSFTLTEEDVEAELSMDYETALSVAVKLTASRPGELLDTVSEKLSKFGVGVSGEKLYFLDAVFAAVEMGEGEGLQIPENRISEKTVEIISGIRSVIEEISGK